MHSEAIWQMFIETGAPEIYMLYNKVRRMEESYVSDSSGVGTSGNPIQ